MCGVRSQRFLIYFSHFFVFQFFLLFGWKAKKGHPQKTKGPKSFVEQKGDFFLRFILFHQSLVHTFPRAPFQGIVHAHHVLFVFVEAALSEASHNSCVTSPQKQKRRRRSPLVRNFRFSNEEKKTHFLREDRCRCIIFSQARQTSSPGRCVTVRSAAYHIFGLTSPTRAQNKEHDAKGQPQ